MAGPQGQRPLFSGDRRHSRELRADTVNSDPVIMRLRGRRVLAEGGQGGRLGEAVWRAEFRE